MTHLGVVWGRRLLAPEWHSAWGLPENDDTEVETQKVLVLLTDGINMAYDDDRTYPGRYRHNGVVQGVYTSHYTGYGRTGPGGSIEEGYRTGTRLSGRSRAEGGVLNTIFQDACDLAKADGTIVFTISAVPHGHNQEQRLRDRLLACATSADHAFVDNSDPARMQAAFQEIGRMVQGIRRTRAIQL